MQTNWQIPVLLWGLWGRGSRPPFSFWAKSSSSLHEVWLPFRMYCTSSHRRLASFAVLTSFCMNTVNTFKISNCHTFQVKHWVLEENLRNMLFSAILKVEQGYTFCCHSLLDFPRVHLTCFFLLLLDHWCTGFLGGPDWTWPPFAGSTSRTPTWQDAAVFCSAEVPGPSADNCLLLSIQVNEYTVNSIQSKLCVSSEQHFWALTHVSYVLVMKCTERCLWSVDWAVNYLPHWLM